MSVVALKNAVVGLVSKNDDDGSSASLLKGDGQTNNSTKDSGNSSSSNTAYGGINRDLEANTEQSSNGGFYKDDSYDSNQNGFSKFLVAGLIGSVDPRVVSDLIIGLSDGLTVPFALTAGLSSLGDAKLVITGGFAELISGTISMGLGGYLGAKSEFDYYKAEVKKQKRTFFDDMNQVNHEVEDILLEINPDFSQDTIISFIKDLQKTPERIVDFIIKYGQGLDEPAENRQVISAATIGGGYFLGGLVPLIPYFFVDNVGTGLIYSIIVMVITLFWFGYIKIQLSMGQACSLQKKVFEGFQMIAVGGVAAGAAWFFVKILG